MSRGELIKTSVFLFCEDFVEEERKNEDFVENKEKKSLEVMDFSNFIYRVFVFLVIFICQIKTFITY